MVRSGAEIRALSPKAKPYKHSLGQGLYILVRPNGRKYWRLKYYFDGRERSYSIGVFPRVSLIEAKALSEAARNLVAQGIDPNAVKREEAKLKQKPVSKTFFRLALSLKGVLTLETESKLLTLTPLQTDALTSFLAVESARRRSEDA